METLWFVLVAFMLASYVVLDGFDLGAGVIHLFAARTPEERQLIHKAIGPVWDGNEVWLVAAGGTLYFAFPLLYASSFSGFYLPLMMVLWLLMLRAFGIEIRSHIESPLWRSFFDTIFSVSSLLLAIFFGAAFGNVIRGVPLNSEGYFFEPLFTDFMSMTAPGILDWYTVLTGVIALVTLTAHGSTYIAVKTTGDLNARARKIAGYCAWVLIALTIVSVFATLSVRPEMLNNYKAHVWGYVFPLLVIVGLGGLIVNPMKGKDLASFISSTLYLVGMLGGAAFALYPRVLPSSTDSSLNLTIYNTAAGHYGLSVGLVWWAIGTLIALGYFTFVYRTFRGKVMAESEGY